jgi:hypothetical protein
VEIDLATAEGQAIRRPESVANPPFVAGDQAPELLVTAPELRLMERHVGVPTLA